MSYRSRYRGFTLIEVMVVLIVMAVLVTAAVPSFQQFIADQRAKVAAQELFITMNYARAEAIRRNALVSVHAAPDGWSNGWCVFLGDDYDCECVADPDGCTDVTATVLRVQPAAALQNVDIDSADDEVSFRGNGRAGALVAFSVCDVAKRARERLIEVDPSGRPQLDLGDPCT